MAAQPTKRAAKRASGARKRAGKGLGSFDGRDVLGTNVAITNAGDGLSKAMSVEPLELHLGETVYVVLECEVSKVRFDPVKDTQAVQRVHILKAGAATMVDGDLVADVLEEQERKIEEAAGVHRLPLGADDPDAPDPEGDDGE